jgi:hypothetical protein
VGRPDRRRDLRDRGRLGECSHPPGRPALTPKGPPVVTLTDVLLAAIFVLLLVCAVSDTIGLG